MQRSVLLLILLIALSPVSFGQQDSTAKKTEPQVKQFWLVILKTGPKDKEITDTTQRKKLFAGHFANMERLHKEGILKAAGPFGENDFTWRGLFILDCKTKEEAESYVQTDPSVAAGIFIVDMVPWYSEPSGSFAPGKPNPDSK